jgi:galactokinase
MCASNERAMSSGFEIVFGRPPEVVASAPGRVNLLGEHTDYNDGFVLPIAIPQQTEVSLGRAPGRLWRVHSRELAETAEFTIDAPPAEAFGRYVYGCVREFADRFVGLPDALDIHVASDVPMNVGLSSSAALEVATLRALRRLVVERLDDVELARVAQQAEIEHVGVRCGIMDQMAASLARPDRALFLDTRSFATRPVFLPEGSALLVLDSGLPRALAGSAYNERRRECEEACRMLGVVSLRDVAVPGMLERLPEPLRRRARHVVSENARVLRAAEGVGAPELGALMNASHASLRDDYEVSVPLLDRLVALLQQAKPRVHGARLPGAGFGGACVALCEAGSTASVAADVLRQYAALGGSARVLVAEATA